MSHLENYKIPKGFSQNKAEKKHILSVFVVFCILGSVNPVLMLLVGCVVWCVIWSIVCSHVNIDSVSPGVHVSCTLLMNPRCTDRTGSRHGFICIINMNGCITYSVIFLASSVQAVVELAEKTRYPVLEIFILV